LAVVRSSDGGGDGGEREVIPTGRPPALQSPAKLKIRLMPCTSLVMILSAAPAHFPWISSMQVVCTQYPHTSFKPCVTVNPVQCHDFLTRQQASKVTRHGNHALAAVMHCTICTCKWSVEYCPHVSMGLPTRACRGCCLSYREIKPCPVTATISRSMGYTSAKSSRNLMRRRPQRHQSRPSFRSAWRKANGAMNTPCEHGRRPIGWHHPVRCYLSFTSGRQ